ncbi:hypothetical protein HY214_02340 [Candidatus Roizmanbacteria bacterium]|nr:hypothetical protein [Candidatus Roizmanbacteria bacterium]
MSEAKILLRQREPLFREAKQKLCHRAQVYPLGERFEGLSPALARIVMLDVSGIPGCHYGLKNVFVPIIENLELRGTVIAGRSVPVSPETAILVEPSTGNGWVAFSDAANCLGYEHIVVIPDGLPEARYRHPEQREVRMIKTPAEDYAAGMPKQMRRLMIENPKRLTRGEKIYITPNHAISGAEITVRTMSELGRQLLQQIGEQHLPLRVVVSMGNGASVCALGEHVKEKVPGSLVVATESFVYGAGYDKFARLKNLPRYEELYGIEPANKDLMVVFSAYGTNAPIGIELPLQERAMNLLDDFLLFTNAAALHVFKELTSSEKFLECARQLPNYSILPRALYEQFGNSTLANIISASRFTEKANELVVAMAYDGRGNYS